MLVRNFVSFSQYLSSTLGGLWPEDSGKSFRVEGGKTSAKSQALGIGTTSRKPRSPKLAGPIPRIPGT